ncbi:MAG: FecR family protein, partial [Bacteroidota bacterium]
MLHTNRNKVIKSSLLIAVLLLLPIFIGADGTEEQTPIGLVKKIVKTVTHRTDTSSDWELAKTGMPLNSGEQVRTGFRSLALVLFTDGSGLLRVRENSILNIYGKEEKKNLNKNTEIEKGFVGFEINKQEAEEFKFTTPTAVAAIRGTEGFIEIGKNNLTIVACSEGKIEVESLIGLKDRIFVEAGFVAIQQQNGKLKLEKLTDDILEKLKHTKNSSLEKLLIETKEGTIEVEYYS